MTQDELKAFLKEDDLFNTLDVRTLVLDRVRRMNDEQLKALFHEDLSSLDTATLSEYLYMKRY